jgi:hypothetical protein
MVSPSIGVCTGDTARASPSCAIWATFVACAFVSLAFVAPRPASCTQATWRDEARPQQTPDVGQASSIRCSRTGHDLAGRRIDDVARRVHRDQRGDDQPVRQRNGCRADAALHCAIAPAELADGCSCAGADVSLGHGSGRGGSGRAVPAVRARPDLRIASDTKVEEHRGRHDRHAGHPRVEPHAAFLEEPHHAGRRVEAERAPARQEDRVHLVDRVDRVEQIGLTRARRRSADVDAGDGAVLDQHDRAAGGAGGEGLVADLDAIDRRQAASRGRWLRRDHHSHGEEPCSR